MMNEFQKIKLRQILSKVGDVSFRRRVVNILKYLDIKEGDLILDCGCGEGFYTMLIRELYGDSCTVVSMDLDLPLMQKARAWLGEAAVSRFVKADVTRLPFRDGLFDKIIFSEVLEHVPDDGRALLEIRRVMKHAGAVALTVPNHNYPLLWDPFNKIREACGLGHFSAGSGFWGGLWAMHLRLYYRNDLDAIVRRAGFNVDAADMITHYCLPFNHLILFIGKRIGNIVPLPAAVSKSMEKFEWQEEQKGFFPSLIRRILRVVDTIDERNDAVEDKNNVSSVCIGMKLIKP